MSGDSSSWRGRAGALCLALLGFLGDPAAAAPRNETADYVSDEARNGALHRAVLWTTPAVAIGEADLSVNPPGPDSFAYDDAVECRIRPSARSTGSTPKFECEFAGGEVLKVKYASPEVFTEVAATRLLHALGAGADRMYLVKTLRCFGCPADPDAMLRCISGPFETVREKCAELFGEVGPGGEIKLKLDYSTYTELGPVAIERRLEGRTLETRKVEGWGFDELDKRQLGRRPPTRAERDALRLVAVLLDHWDNRPDNQRLLCLPGGRGGDAWCDRPLAYIQDVGGTFGRVGGDKDERKLDLEAWRSAPLWKDAAACRVSIKSPLLHGASFGEATISESGRRFLAERLSALSEAQIRGLFEGSHFADYKDASAASRDASGWVAAFQDKVRQITERSACPTS
jgi:hypothetical protein